MKKIRIPFIYSVYKKFSGADVNVIYKEIDEDNNGFDITGLVKNVEEDNKGLSITGLDNHFKKVKQYSVSYATLGNTIKEIGENAFYLQIGLVNKAGDKYCPFINVGGIKNIPKLIGKSFKRKKNKNKNLNSNF